MFYSLFSTGVFSFQILKLVFCITNKNWNMYRLSLEIQKEYLEFLKIYINIEFCYIV